MCFWALPVLPKDHYERVYDADKSRHLRDAAMTGDIQMFKEVLGYENIDVNARAEDECTALHLAAQNGELKVVQILLDDGRCDVDALEHRDSTTPTSPRDRVSRTSWNYSRRIPEPSGTWL